MPLAGLQTFTVKETCCSKPAIQPFRLETGDIKIPFKSVRNQ